MARSTLCVRFEQPLRCNERSLVQDLQNVANISSEKGTIQSAWGSGPQRRGRNIYR